MKRTRALTATVTAAIALALSAGPAEAASTQPAPSGNTVFVSNGKSIPATTTTETFSITPGEGPVGKTWATTPPPGQVSTQATWGSSYAISKEISSITYAGYAKAGGNVFTEKGSTLRIVAVCVWYTQDARKSQTVCSNAAYRSGQWMPGNENAVKFGDTLNPVAPQTQFNIQTTRIAPQATG